MANNVQLINCSGVIVHGDVERFIGMGLNGLVIDNTYSDSELKGSDIQGGITGDTDIDRTDHKKIILVNAGAGDVTLTIDTYNANYLEFTIIRTDASANSVFINSTNIYGTESFNGNAMPFDLGLSQYDTRVLKVDSDTIRIVADYSVSGGSGGGAWGSITGTISSQTDLMSVISLRI